MLLSGTILTKSDPDSFYISNKDIIIEIFNDITLLRQDINEKENRIKDLNHRLEILSVVSELKLNDINNQITTIHTALSNTTSSHKAQNNCPKISSNQDTDEIKFLREELKNKNTIINILSENIFSNNKSFSSYENLEDYKIIKITFKGINSKNPHTNDRESNTDRGENVDAADNFVVHPVHEIP